MNANAFRFELRLGSVREDMVRVGLPADMLLKASAGDTRRALCEAAVRAFRSRAFIAGHPASAIEEEVSRFTEAVARTA